VSLLYLLHKMEFKRSFQQLSILLSVWLCLHIYCLLPFSNNQDSNHVHTSAHTFLSFIMELCNAFGLVAFVLLDTHSWKISDFSNLDMLSVTNTLSRPQNILRFEYIYVAIVPFIYLYQFYQNYLIMQVIYFILVCCTITKLDSIHTIIHSYTFLYFILSVPSQRFFLIFIVTPTFYVMTQIYKDLCQHGNGANEHNTQLTTAKKLFVLLLVNLAYQAFATAGGQFDMSVEVRAGTIGVLNVEYTPMLSAFFMLYHKIGVFFIMTAYLGRIITYDKESIVDNTLQNNYGYLTSQQSIGRYLWSYLLLKSVVLMWIFHLAFWLYKDYLTCFIMTMTTALITVLFGAVLIANQLPSQLMAVFHSLSSQTRTKTSFLYQ